MRSTPAISVVATAPWAPTIQIPRRSTPAVYTEQHWPPHLCPKMEHPTAVDTLSIAVDAAKAAAMVLAEGFAGDGARLLGRRHHAENKQAFDLVTEFDRRAEAILVE